MKAYAESLRERVVAAIERGTRRCDVVETLAVSLRTIKRWLKQQRETGDPAAKPIPGPPAIKRGAPLEALLEPLAEHANATLAEYCAWRHEGARSARRR
jgi:transposase